MSFSCSAGKSLGEKLRKGWTPVINIVEPVQQLLVRDSPAFIRDTGSLLQIKKEADVANRGSGALDDLCLTVSLMSDLRRIRRVVRGSLYRTFGQLTETISVT